MSGKDGSPGLKVSLNYYENFMHFCDEKLFPFIQGLPGVGERGFTGAKGDRGDKVNLLDIRINCFHDVVELVVICVY